MVNKIPDFLDNPIDVKLYKHINFLYIIKINVNSF